MERGVNIASTLFGGVEGGGDRNRGRAKRGREEDRKGPRLLSAVVHPDVDLALLLQLTGSVCIVGHGTVVRREDEGWMIESQ